MNLIPKGNYRAKADPSGADFGQSGKGSDFVLIPYVITQGEYAGTVLGYRGFFTEKTTARTIESLMYSGCTFPSGEVTDLTGLGSTEVEIVVDHEEYEGKWYARIQWVNKPFGISEQQKMDPSKKADFGSRMRGALAAVRQDMAQRGTLPVPTPNGLGAANGAQSGDDIPF